MKNRYMRLSLNFILSFITYCSFSDLIAFKHYDFISLFIFLMVLILYSNFHLLDKFKFNSKIKLYGMIFCLILSLTHVLGFNVFLTRSNYNISVLRQMLTFKTLIDITGLFLFLYCFYSQYIDKVISFSFLKKNSKITNKKVFLFSFVFILLCWLPYYLVLYPGILTNDSKAQFLQFVNGLKISSDHHPVVHTLFMWICYRVGDLFFDDPVNITGFVSFVQMILMAGIFSYFITWLNSLKLNIKIIIFSILVFALSPIHAYYSVTMWKDILFGGFVLLFIIFLIKMDTKKFDFFMMIKFIILSLLVLFFRNNALYMYLFLVPFTFFHYKGFRLKISSCLVISLAFFFLIKGPVFSHFGIRKSASSEYISMPLQQIGRMAKKNVSFKDEQINLINNVIDISILSSVYNPSNCDPIKFNPNYNILAFNENKLTYFKLWFDLVIEHPSVAIEAYLNSTLGYWYSNVDYWATVDVVEKNDFGVYRSPKLGGIFDKYVHNITSRQLPIISLQWSIGLCVIFLFSFAFIIFLKREYFKLFYFIPLFGIWITMMVASPVFAEFRYVYSFFTCLPLFVILPFVGIIRNK